MRLSNISIDISLSDSRSIKMDKSVKMDVTISSIINLLQNSVNEEDVLRILKRYIEKNTISKVDIRKHSNSLLVIACNKNYLEAIEFLISLGANVNVKDNKGYSPLHIATINDNLDSFLFLLENGGNPKLKSECGNNVLHLAIKSNSKNIVFHLLKRCDMDVNLKNDKGILPINLTDDKLIQNLLIEHGALSIDKEIIERIKKNELENKKEIMTIVFSIILLYTLSFVPFVFNKKENNKSKEIQVVTWDEMNGKTVIYDLEKYKAIHGHKNK